MSRTSCAGRRIAGAVVAGCAGFVLAASAGAVDLRDWGRKLEPADRFVVLSQFGNEAVLDKETQLVWQKSPYPANSWATAYMVCLSSFRAGRQGWRLPTHSEIATLMERGAPSMPSVFTILSGVYWTATDHPTSDQHVLAIPAPEGGWVVTAKNESRPYICVRGAT